MPRTLSLLDMAYKKVNEIKIENQEITAKIELLKTKIAELKQLAIQLKAIAYKDNLTNTDIDTVMSIVKKHGAI